MALITCKECGKEFSSNAAACPHCGNPIAVGPAEIVQGKSNVGNNVNVVVSGGVNNAQKSRTTYVLLACFLGFLGVHNFYAGRTGCGVVQLLMTLLSCGSLLPIVFIWSVIEVFTVSIDGRGADMKPCSAFAMIFSIILLFWPLWVAIIICYMIYSNISGGSGSKMIYRNVSGGSAKESIIKGQMAFYHSRGYIAGEYLAKIAPGKKMLLIANPGWDTSRMDGTLIEALKKNYGEVEIDTIVVPPNAEEQGIMISELMTNKELDAIIDKHPDAGVVAFLYGLPENPQRMKIFTKKDRPVIFLFEMGSAEGKWLTKKLADGTISGLIISKRGVKHTTPPKRNDKDTFDVRYVLVTHDNIVQNAELLM